MERATSIEVSVIVPTYNQGHLLGTSLGSLLHQTMPADSYEVIVINDGSTDGTPQALAGFQADARLRAVTLPANRGRSVARNAGLAEARGRIVVFVDSDIIVRKDFLAAHLAMHRDHGGQVVSRGPIIPIADPDGVPESGLPLLASSPAYFDTANAGVPTEAVRRAGMFDENFPGYGWEDFELGIRLKASGLRRVFHRRAVAFHVEPPRMWERLEAELARETERARSAAYFFRKQPLWETRLLIQATPVHHAAYWLQTAGGFITPENVSSVAGRVDRAGFPTLAWLLHRGVMNRYYLRMLEEQL